MLVQQMVPSALPASVAVPPLQWRILAPFQLRLAWLAPFPGPIAQAAISQSQAMTQPVTAILTRTAALSVRSAQIVVSAMASMADMTTATLPRLALAQVA